MMSGCIRVRAFREADVQPLHEAVCESIAEVAPYETWCHPGYSLDEAKDYVTWWIKARERRSALYYAVEDTSSSRLLGVCGVSDVVSEHRHAMLGYWVRTSETGRGVATTAARLASAAETWSAADGIPIVDYSSPLPGGRFGQHAETLDADDFGAFLAASREVDVDVMLEIKDKELSALRAVELARGDARFVG